ncbi:unnamed protein product, partial [Sphacelaria rigidula]
LQSLQELAAALLHSLRSCGTLLVLIATVWFGYSLVGVELFGGMFYSCSDPHFPAKAYRGGEYDSLTNVWVSPPCSGDWVDPDTQLQETRDFNWENSLLHFDSIGPAMLSVLTVSTLDGWVQVFHDASSAVAIDYQPSENSNNPAFWYFFAGIIVFGFYITNLFVGVMFEAFLSYKNMDGDGKLVSQEERRWRDYEKRLCQVSPVVAPCNCDGRKWRINIQQLVLSNCFNNFIIGILVVNAVVLAVDGANVSDSQSTVQDIFNDGFAFVFVVEASLALIGLGPSCYFSTGRQTFDFVVTVASLADVFFTRSHTCSGGDIVLLRLVRSLRVFRIIRLATYIPGFNQILAACTYPSRILASVFVLLSLGAYIFANIGVALFASAEEQTGTANNYQDFSSVWRGMQLLFIVSTGEAWAEYASAVAVSSDQPESLVMLFFLVFVIVSQFILTNLFIMVIVETFEVLNAMERQDLEDQLPQFQDLWATFDPSGDGFIPPKYLFTFLEQLGKPLGAAGNHSTAGRYLAMLRSSAEFDHSFTRVLLGLGAALLSDDSRAASGKSYRPVDLRRTMATLVIQRALKRNVGQNRSRHLFANVVLAAREQ